MDLNHLFECLAKRMESKETFVHGCQPLVSMEMISDKRFMYLSRFKPKKHETDSNTKR